MAVKEFEKPELKDYSPIPKLVEEASSTSLGIGE